MNAHEHVSWLSDTRKNLMEVYQNKGIPCEPIVKSVWKDFGYGKFLISVFVHEKDKNRNTLKSFRYPYREI